MEHLTCYPFFKKLLTFVFILYIYSWCKLLFLNFISSVSCMIQTMWFIVLYLVIMFTYC